MENKLIKSGFRNIFFVLSAQLVSLLLGITKILILPILLGVNDFGYWQVYLLYVTYVGVLSLGFNDGIYLRYGGYSYTELPKDIFRSSIRLFFLMQLIVMILISFMVFLEPDSNKQISLLWVTINIPVSGLTGILIYLLQVTNQLKKYSFYVVIDKILVLAMLLLIFLIGVNSFESIILIDTVSKVITLILMGYSCRDLFIGKGVKISIAIKELYNNINVGLKVMVANLAGMLLLGIGRFVVERFEPIEVYSIYSFSISTINLILILVMAIGLVVYPTLIRLEKKNFPKYFLLINQIITVLVFGLLALYFPLKLFILKFMSDYSLIFNYLPLIFAIVFIESKMQIIINPFYKLLRKEKSMLNANIIGLLIAIVLILPVYFITNSVVMVALGTMVTMSIRLYLSEVYLKKKLQITGANGISLEMLGIFIFIFCAYQSNTFIGFSAYLSIYSIYVLKNLKIVKEFFYYLKRS